MSRSYKKTVKLGVCYGSNTDFYRRRRRKFRTVNKQMLRNLLANREIDDVNDLIEINKINKILMSELIILKLIGEGAQSKVYEGYYKRNHCAIKILQNVDYKSFMSELVIMCHLNHPSIPKFYGIVN